MADRLTCGRCGTQTLGGEILTVGTERFLLCEGCCDWLLNNVNTDFDPIDPTPKHPNKKNNE